jgi:hypothetical protein
VRENQPGSDLAEQGSEAEQALFAVDDAEIAQLQAVVVAADDGRRRSALLPSNRRDLVRRQIGTPHVARRGGGHMDLPPFAGEEGQRTAA